jgi:hypothetical protein
VKWYQPAVDDTFTLGLAMALGVSERFFDQVVTLVGNLGGAPSASQSPARPPTGAPGSRPEEADQEHRLIDLHATREGLFELKAGMEVGTAIQPTTKVLTIGDVEVTAEEAGLPADARGEIVEIVAARGAHVTPNALLIRVRKA